MTTTAIQHLSSEKPLTAHDIRAHVNLIQEVMQAVMKKDTHYGIIPGCKKPSLWKPGAEVLFTTFRISVDPVVEDLSTRDEARFRVTARATSASGIPLGSAVGEASSDEEKYKWRAMVCQEEYDATPDNERRIKWKDGRQGPYCVQQVRTNIADCRNTILKMSAKRASVALALQVTAASDIFTQDIEDLPVEVQAAAMNGDAEPEAVPLPTEIKRKEPMQGRGPTTDYPLKNAAGEKSPNTIDAGARVQRELNPTPPVKPPIHSPKPPTGRTISEAQARRFYAIWKSAGRDKEEVEQYLREVCRVSSDRDMPPDRYNTACAWAEGHDEPEPSAQPQDEDIPF